MNHNTREKKARRYSSVLPVAACAGLAPPLTTVAPTGLVPPLPIVAPDGLAVILRLPQASQLGVASWLMSVHAVQVHAAAAEEAPWRKKADRQVYVQREV